MPTVSFENFEDVPLTRAPMLDPGTYVVAIKSFEDGQKSRTPWLYA